jgi:hypothetical protein
MDSLFAQVGRLQALIQWSHILLARPPSKLLPFITIIIKQGKQRQAQQTPC